MLSWDERPERDLLVRLWCVLSSCSLEKLSEEEHKNTQSPAEWVLLLHFLSLWNLSLREIFPLWCANKVPCFRHGWEGHFSCSRVYSSVVQRQPICAQCPGSCWAPIPPHPAWCSLGGLYQAHSTYDNKVLTICLAPPTSCQPMCTSVSFFNRFCMIHKDSIFYPSISSAPSEASSLRKYFKP